MPARSRGEESGASGRRALAVLRDTDWEDIVATVHFLPTLADEKGSEVALAFARTELRSLMGLLGLARPETREAAAARSAVGSFFEDGSLRLLIEDGRAGFRYRVAFLSVLQRELFETAVRAVFERSAPSDRAPYVPQVTGGP